MRVWIDMTNSPHVRFFTPLVADLEARGHTVEITAREYAQTRELLDLSGLHYTLIGRHRGRSLAHKAYGLASRSLRLVAFASGKRFDVAFGHNSNDLAVAAWLLRIPHLMVHDYEHATLSYAINARLATRILVPEAIPLEAVIAHGARPNRVGSFPGLKEHVYLDREPPRAEAVAALRASLGVEHGQSLVVVRPPATMSAYHRFSNELFDGVLEHVVSRADACVVVVPRTPEQRVALTERFGDRVLLPERAVDGSVLIAAADCVLSAGGTMNREAAVLGTPAYTVFAGTMGAVDRDLVARGLLVEVRAPGDVIVRPKVQGAGYHVENRPLIVAELERLPEGRHA